MNRKHFFFTLVALAGLALTACTKEPKAEPADYTVQYCIDGNLQQTVLTDDGELGDFVLGLMPYVRDGHVVVLVNDDSNPQAKGDVVTFRTASDTAAAAWATEKYLQGYTVTISFDTETSEYVCSAEIKESRNSRQPLSSEMLLGLWEQIDGCPCNNGFDLCFYPDGNLFISQRCDSSSYYTVDRDTLWIEGTRPAIVQFDTLSDGTIVMYLHIKLPLCLQPGDDDKGWFDYTYVKGNGIVGIVNEITSEDIQGAWVQVEECDCISSDTLQFDSINLVNTVDQLSPGTYCASGNTLYEMISSGSTIEHPIKLATWPDGKKMVRIERQNNPCNTNNTLETLNYIFI